METLAVIDRPPLDRSQIWYRRLVRLYPKAFRDRFGPEIILLFDDIYRDLQYAPPRDRTWRLVATSFDTIASIGQEQATALYQRLTKDLTMSKKPTSSSSARRFVTRHPRLTVFLTGLVVVLVIGAWAGPTLTASASGLYLREQAYTATSRHTNQARVASLFVNDYIAAKQGLPTKRPSGNSSPLTMEPGITMDRSVHDYYRSVQPGFDPFLCSSTLPTKASFDTDLTGPSFGFASVTARFSYADSPTENTVRYLLAMKQGSNEGWRVVNVSCTSLNHSPNPPFELWVRPDSELSIDVDYQ